MLANQAVVAVLVGGFAFVASCRESEPAPPQGAITGDVATPATSVQPSTIAPASPCAFEDCQPFLIAKLATERGTAIALDGAGFAYVSTFFDDAIYRVPLQPGATPTLLYRSPGANLGNVEVHGDELRWSSNEAGRIYAAPISGTGPVRVVAETVPGIWGFASDEEWIYWADFGGSAPGTVWKKPLRGGPSVAIARHPASLLVDHVFIQGPSDLLYTDESAHVLHSSTSGGTPDVWVEVDVEGARDFEGSGVAQDAMHLYVSSYSTGIVRVNKATREVETFLTTPGPPGKVAVDATHVYWIGYAPVELWARRK